MKRKPQLFLGGAAVALLLSTNLVGAQPAQSDQPRGQMRAQDSQPRANGRGERIQDMNRGTGAQNAQTAPGSAQTTPPSTNSAAPNQQGQSGMNQPAAQQRSQATNQPAQQQASPPASQNQGQTTVTQQQPSTSQQSGSQQNGQPAATNNQQPSQSPPQTGQSQPQQRPPIAAQNNQQRTTSGVVSLSTQQQTTVGRTLARHNVRPLTNVNFSISVGTRVPRSVTLRALPADLVTFVPQYRGYSYFVVEEQIVIVEPSTHEIVTIVPYTSATKAVTREKPAKPMASRSVNLNTEQREVIRRNAKKSSRESTTARRTYKSGDTIDRTVTIESFPETVYEEVPVVRRYRYFRDEDDVILVDPDEDRVVDVIR